MKKQYILFLLFLFPALILSAQSSKQKKADRLYDDFAYVKAIDEYQNLLERNYNEDYNKRKLGDSYFLLRDPENAAVYYQDVVQQPDVSPEYYFKYAQVLRGIREYDESREWLHKYQDAGKNSSRVENFLDENGISTYKGFESFRIEPAEMNSEFSDFGAYNHNDVIYFTSARGEGPKSKIYDWNGEPFLDIYQTNSEYSTVTPVKGDVNTVRHEGPVSISADGKTMYFTRNNYYNNRNGKRDKEGVNHLKIYKATLENNTWGNIEELPFNNNSYSVGHPSLSKDGKTLYFASDSPEGYGGTDLYKVIIEDSTYGKPENLGEEINTSGNEVFPFITEENSLYFSSDGHKGYGLLDIFIVDLEKEQYHVQNLGEPINSSRDDFGFTISPDNSSGFISSNRPGGIGSDDIYEMKVLSPLILKGTVTDSINAKPIANANIRLMDENDNQIVFLETDSIGNYRTEISRDKEYPIEAKHIKYDTKTGKVSSLNTDTKSEIIYDIELSPVNDVEYLAEINKIYFDFDKFEIRPDAAEELDKLVELMSNDYPELVIEIGSHTDIRGSKAYNDQLAEKRARATYDYLISKGISKERIITYRGYGERQPEIDCTKCNEKQHQLNRRSIFKVVKME